MPTPIVAAAVLTLVLAACTTPRPLPADAGERLFTEGLSQIGDLYIRPVSNHILAVAGLAGLHRLDPALGVTETPGGAARLQLLFGGREAASYPIPAGEDPESWGELIGRVVAGAKKASPTLAGLPGNDIDKAVFDGVTGALDPFSRYVAPAVASEQRAARDGFGGIGIALDEAGGVFRVGAVTPGSPAASAGMRTGDEIVAVDGTPVAGHPEGAVAQQLRGPVDSPIEITVRRASDPNSRRSFRLQRALIVAPTVTVTQADGVAVFRITTFNQDTAHELAEDLKSAEARSGGGLRGAVLDLRSDPGGLLEQAVSVADLFVAAGPIASTVGRHPASHQFFAASGKGAALRLPVVVLINGRSASASEIVAAALQDAGRAVIVGSASYGKGTVQTVSPLPDGGDLILTWALLATPSGYLLNRRGVVPTLCTSDLRDDAPSLRRGLERVSAPAAITSLGPRQRASLDDAAWSQLRRSCPPRRDENPLDVELAKRVLADPALYEQALHAITGAKLAAAPPALTPGSAALSSETSAP